MEFDVLLILILCGLLVNVMSALFGIGGGVLMVPILRTIFSDLPLQVIAACSLTIVMGSALINLTHFQKAKEQIEKRNLIIWSLCMIIGVQLGFKLSFLLTDFFITLIFSCTLTLLAIKTLLHKQREINTPQATTVKELGYGGVSCSFGGFIAGITGIGGGSIMAPLVAQIRSVKPKQVPIYTNYMMVLGGIGNLFGYLALPLENASPIFPNWQIGYINFAIVGIVVTSSFTFSFFTMNLRSHLSPKLTTQLLGILLLLIAIYSVCLNWLE